ncbi:hypothetical protein CI102_865 [Trichoderma harzianum]|nr:hypothetical protein CI102_865 [Trichoderma harzianum]
MCMKKPETKQASIYICFTGYLLDLYSICRDVLSEINIFEKCHMYAVGDIFFMRGASQARFQPFLYRPRPVSLIFVIRCQMRHVRSQLVLRTPPAVVAPPPTCIRPGPSRYIHWWDRLELARSGGTGTPIALLGRSLREGSAQVPVPLRIPFSGYFVPVRPSLSSLQVKFPSVLSVPAKHRTTILQARLLLLQRPPIGCPIGCREQWQDPVAAIVAFSSISQSLCRLGTLLVAPSTFLAGGSHGGAPYRNRLSAVTPIKKGKTEDELTIRGLREKDKMKNFSQSCLTMTASP